MSSHYVINCKTDRRTAYDTGWAVLERGADTDRFVSWHGTKREAKDALSREAAETVEAPVRPTLEVVYVNFLRLAKADLQAAGKSAGTPDVAAELGITPAAVRGAVTGHHTRTLDQINRWCRIWEGKGYAPIRIVADSAGVRLERTERNPEIEVWQTFEGEPEEQVATVTTRPAAMAEIRRLMRRGDFKGAAAPWAWELRHPDGTVEPVLVDGDTYEEV